MTISIFCSTNEMISMTHSLSHFYNLNLSYHVLGGDVISLSKDEVIRNLNYHDIVYISFYSADIPACEQGIQENTLKLTISVSGNENNISENIRLYNIEIYDQRLRITIGKIRKI